MQTRKWCNLPPELPSGDAELLISRQRGCRRQASSLSADVSPSRLDQPCLSTRTSVRDSTRHSEADHERRTPDSRRRSNYRCAAVLPTGFLVTPEAPLAEREAVLKATGQGGEQIQLVNN